jgi:hypothetical protein
VAVSADSGASREKVGEFMRHAKPAAIPVLRRHPWVPKDLEGHSVIGYQRRLQSALFGLKRAVTHGNSGFGGHSDGVCVTDTLDRVERLARGQRARGRKGSARFRPEGRWDTGVSRFRPAGSLNWRDQTLPAAPTRPDTWAFVVSCSGMTSYPLHI